MRIIECKQGTPEWLAVRAGIPTASCFDRIITPKTMKPSASAGKYMARLIAEWFLGQPLDDGSSQFMERGTAMESEARAWYALTSDADVRQVGFCIRDDGAAGCSPDSLVGSEGLLEIKCPGAEQHADYLVNGMGDAYRCQVQGQLWVTGRKWCDLLSYNPAMPKVLFRCERDEPFIAALAEAVGAFSERLGAEMVRRNGEREAYHTAKVAAAESDPF